MDKTITKVLEEIEKNQYEAYIVGGYVRDHLLGIETSDIDICTNATPKQLIKIFQNENPTSTDYGNILLSINNYRFDITTYRREISYKDNRKPEEIVYINNLLDDLKRRDFTINAICMDKEENITDPLHGVDDLNKGIVKSIGTPIKKLEEDALRILRAIRFATKFKFQIDQELENAIQKNKHLLKKLSFTRKKEELSKMFTSPHKDLVVEYIKEYDLEKELNIKNIENILLSDDITAIWSYICIDDSYPFTKHERKIIEDVNYLKDKEITKELLYKYGIYVVTIVCDLKQLDKTYYNKLYNDLPIKSKNEIAIDGDNICKLLNKEPGSFLKDIIQDLESNILNNNIENNKETLEEYIIKKYKNN